MWRLGDAAGRVCATSEIHNCYFGLVPFSPPTLPPPRRFKPPYACLQTAITRIIYRNNTSPFSKLRRGIFKQ